MASRSELGELEEAWVVLGKVWRGGGRAMHHWFPWFVPLTRQLGRASIHLWRGLPLIVRVQRLSPLVGQDRGSLRSREHLNVVVIVELVHRVHISQWFSKPFEISPIWHSLLGLKLWRLKLREHLIGDTVVVIIIEAQLWQLEVVVLVSELLFTSKPYPGILLLLLLLLAGKLKRHIRAQLEASALFAGFKTWEVGKSGSVRLV